MVLFPTYEEAIRQNGIPLTQLNLLVDEGRQRIKNARIISSLIGLVLIIVPPLLSITAEIQSNFSNLSIYYYVIVFSVALVFNVLYAQAVNFKCNEAYKKMVIAPLAESIISLAQINKEGKNHKQTVSLNSLEHVGLEWIKKSNLFNHSYNRDSGADHFYGQFGLSEFHFSELELKKVKQSGKHRVVTTIFKGLFFTADFKKDFSGVTLLIPNAIRDVHGVNKLVNQALNAINSNTSLAHAYNIEVENEAFNNIFQIITTDEIEARYILSSSFMEKILAFVARHNTDIFFSFSESNMFIAIETDKNFFDHNFLQKGNNFYIKEAYDDLVFLFSIIEDFELNTRIWSKQ